MNALLAPQLDTTLDDFLDDLEAEFQISPSQFAAAERSYTSVGEWLNRKDSSLARFDPQVYVQGSFRLGTAIKPLGEDDEYDVDAVCELKLLTKKHASQSKLKELLGAELQAYANARNMQKPVEERRCCWTLHYADEAQFHLDVVPAVPNSEQQRRLLESRNLPVQLAETAIAITNIEHPQYLAISDDWPRSNPKGYGVWFKSRMTVVFEKRRKAIALNERAEVEQIPENRVRTPLQSAVKFLKRHRDIMFAGDATDAPISIILTTLSAHAYQGEETTSSAIRRILTDMDKFVLVENGVSVIANPSDPLENFADKWNKHPERRAAFFEWLERARNDFSNAEKAYGRQAVSKSLSSSLGTSLTERALSRRSPKTLAGTLLSWAADAKEMVLRASHRRRPTWPQNLVGRVSINLATYSRSGFRPQSIQSDGQPISKNCSLRFEASTNVVEPYKVYWQVVNTGDDAERAKGLRGTFEFIEKGGLTKNETSLYRGTHAIECFIVKNGTLVARSGQFVVKVA